MTRYVSDPEPNLDPPLFAVLETARAAGAHIHDLPSAVTATLAEDYRIYTASEPRDPGSFREFRTTYGRERAMNTIAGRLGDMLGRTAAYKDAVQEKALGRTLTEVFNSVSQVEADEVHWATGKKVGKDQYGIATAETMRLVVPDTDTADKLQVALQGLLSVASPQQFYAVTAKDMPPRVEIEKLDEHAARSISRSVEAIVAVEDHAQGITLPAAKRTYTDWKAAGETFPWHTAQRLEAAEQAYRRLVLTASYTDRPDLRPKPKPRIIGSDSAAVMEGMRDILNGLIHDVRGGSHHNLEQHPDKTARPILEENIDLRRNKAKPEDVSAGPLSSRPASSLERSWEYGRGSITNARQRPIATLVRTSTKIPSGASDIATKLIKHIPTFTERAKKEARSLQEWRARKFAASEGAAKLDRLAKRLRREAEGLPVWEED